MFCFEGSKNRKQCKYVLRIYFKGEFDHFTVALFKNILCVAFITNQLTNTMVLSSSWEANSHPANQ